MSRIGKKPVPVPAGVTAKVEGQKVVAKGPKGELNFTVPDEVAVTLDGNEVKVDPRSDSKRARAMWGMSRSMVNNIMAGVTKGFERKLEITGVGYKAAVVGKNLQLSLGYSHDVIRSRPVSRLRPPSRRKSRSRASTSARSARSPRRSAPSVAPNPTRARASVMRASSSSARKARRSKELAMTKDNKADGRRKARVRRSIRARAYGKPRLSVHRTSKQIYAQIIDDEKGATIVAASSLEKDQREALKTGADVEAAKVIGKLIAQRAVEKGIKDVVFDRGGYVYHGRVKALAEGAREGGLNF